MIVALSAGRESSREVRARLALDETGTRGVLRAPREGISELVVLSTCHRTELYAAGQSLDVHAVAGLLPGLQAGDHDQLRFFEGPDAVEHLFRVACGLDSLVVGEPQVLSQVRRAFNTAREENATGGELAHVFARAIRIGRAARGTTNLGTVVSSIGALTAAHLAERFGGLEGRAGAIVGAGRAAGDAASALHAAGARLSVVGRSLDRTRRLAASVGGEPYFLDRMPQVLHASDFAVVAVNGGVLVEREHVPLRDVPLVLVDISVPRSVDIVGRADIEVRTIDDLSVPERPDLRSAVEEVERMIAKAMNDFDRLPVRRDAGLLRTKADGVVEAEIAKVIARHDLDAREAEMVASLGYRIARKLLHGPTVAMRDGNEQMRALVREMFGLGPDHE